MKLQDLTTETRNVNSMQIDHVSTLEMVKIINHEDQKIAGSIEKVADKIAKVIDQAAERYQEGGRLVYLGAGTSGRLGILDAVELLPTYNVSSERALALIAGGESAMFKAVEGAEDSKELAVKDLKEIALTEKDILLGLSASGRTPYVIAGLEYANKIGALSVSIACNENSQMGQTAQIGIDVPVGPEVVTGSTRMKAGTAQKMILNMISTGIMIKVGKVYQNLMVNVLATNEKLVERGIRIIAESTGIEFSSAKDYFEQAGKKVNVAILMIELMISSDEAEKLLATKDGNLAKIIRNWKKDK